MSDTTNAFTAQAATETIPRPNRDLALLGIYDSPNGAAILLRKEDGTVTRLEQGTPEDDLTLEQVGPGWALVRHADTVLRLVLL